MQLISKTEPNKPSAFKSLGGKAAECIPPDMNFPKEFVKNHAALVSGYYTEGCTYIYLFIGSQIEQRTLRPH